MSKSIQDSLALCGKAWGGKALCEKAWGGKLNWFSFKEYSFPRWRWVEKALREKPARKSRPLN